MSQLDDIKAGLNQTYNTNILRVGFLADSIWSPSGSEKLETDGTHPPFRLNDNYFIRQLFDNLNYNRPTFRSIEHTDWSHTGGLEENGTFPNTNKYDKIQVLSSDSDESILTTTGNETIIIWLEGGESGKVVDTGTVEITVSTDGINYDTPANLGLSGEKITGRGDTDLGYENPLSELDTNLIFPYIKERVNSNYSYVSYRELQYNGLNPATTYYFKVKRKVGTNDIRLGGSIAWTGKTCVFYNLANPGVRIDVLRSSLYNYMGIKDFHYLIAQSTIYHDRLSYTEIEDLYKMFLAEAKQYCTRIIMCACTPGGVVVEDSAPVLGDEDPAYVKGQNVVKEFNNRFIFNIVEPTYADYPNRDDVYRFNINGTDYDCRSLLSKTSEEDFPTWSYNTKLAFFTENVPADDIVYPLTITRVSGTGAASFELTSLDYNQIPMPTHRDMIQSLSNRYGVQFMDLYQLFADLAVANGETTETDGYSVQVDSPLYAEYPDGEENYLSRYFSPNHWRPDANPPVTEKFEQEVFNNKFQLD